MHIAVAMSGGVDSLRTAVLLKEEGHDVLGIHMRLVSAGGAPCNTVDGHGEREKAIQALAADFSIPLVVLDLRKEFEEKVVIPFLEAYLNGLTPNPCAVCNPQIKFGPLLEESRRQGMKFLATGHYARILPPDSTSDRFRLLRGIDTAKDQSYFLSRMSQDQLARALFPLGNRTKNEVLGWARKTGLSARLPEESQEICFIPSGDYQEFLKMKLNLGPGSTGGRIVDVQGTLLGEHKGIFAYTIGQRRGLGLASSAPYYVVGIDPASNTVRVGRARDLLCNEFEVEGVNWVSISTPEEPIRGEVRIRNQHQPASAWITPSDESQVAVLFDEPQRAVTPGQAAVFYDGDLVLGGGMIKRKGRVL